MTTPEPIRVSYSSLRSYQTCQRLYHYAHQQRLVPNVRRVALDFGSAWHKAVGVYLEGGTVEASYTTFTDTFTEEPGDTLRTHTTARRMLQNYAKQYPPGDITVLKHEHWIEVPLPTSVPSVYVMQLDRLIRYNQQPTVMEHKTTSGYQGISATYVRSFKPNLQLAGYVYGARTSTLEDYRQVLVDVAWVGRTQPKTGEAFLLYPETIENWELEEFLRLACGLVEEIAEKREPHTYLPNWSACTQYGACAYREVCLSAPSIRPTLLTRNYHYEAPHGPPD